MEIQRFEDKQTATDEVIKADDHFIALSNAEKFEELTDLLVDDFTYVNHHGTIFDRDAFIELLKTYRTTATLRQDRPREVHVFAKNLAVVNGVVEVEYQVPTISKTGLATYSRVWMKKGEEWLSVSLHASDAQLMETWEKLLASSRSIG